MSVLTVHLKCGDCGLVSPEFPLPRTLEMPADRVYVARFTHCDGHFEPVEATLPVSGEPPHPESPRVWEDMRQLVEALATPEAVFFAPFLESDGRLGVQPRKCPRCGGLGLGVNFGGPSVHHPVLAAQSIQDLVTQLDGVGEATVEFTLPAAVRVKRIRISPEPVCFRWSIRDDSGAPPTAFGKELLRALEVRGSRGIRFKEMGSKI